MPLLPIVGAFFLGRVVSYAVLAGAAGEPGRDRDGALRARRAVDRQDDPRNHLAASLEGPRPSPEHRQNGSDRAGPGRRGDAAVSPGRRLGSGTVGV